MTESINKAGGNANMATYKQIQEYLKYNYGFVPKTCWIAHMKEVCGIYVKKAPNRISPDKREKPCPIDKQKYIKKAFEHFNMI